MQGQNPKSSFRVFQRGIEQEFGMYLNHGLAAHLECSL
jgi:hypothetical protein